MRMKMMLMATILGAAASLAACHHKDSSTSSGGTTPAAGEQKSLYDRLGGKDAIDAVVEDFVGNVAADARINAFFANADIPHLKQMLKDQICSATGGPCKYTGKDMKTAHAGMGIKEADFNALVEDLKKSLDKFKVGEKEQSDLLGALGGMKGDIVGQ
jgi:hemoglobin